MSGGMAPNEKVDAILPGRQTAVIGVEKTRKVEISIHPGWGASYEPSMSSPYQARRSRASCQAMFLPCKLDRESLKELCCDPPSERISGRQ